MNQQATRRAFVGALAAAPAIAVVALPSTVLADTGGSVTEAAFFAKVEAMKQAYAVARAYEDNVYNPAWQAWLRECEAIPHVTLEPDPYSHKFRPVSTARKEDVQDARRDTRGRYWIDPQYPDVVAHYELMERLKTAADTRDAEVARLRTRYNIDALYARSEELDTIATGLENELIGTPAPSSAALGWKIERLWADDPGASFCDKWTDALVADARRLLAGRA